MAKQHKVVEEEDTRHNLSIAEIKRVITLLFEPFVSDSYGQLVNQFGKGSEFGFNQEHIDAANSLEDERSRIILGFEALDKCQDYDHFKRISKKIMENVEGPLCDALITFFDKFLDAMDISCKETLK